MDYQFYERIHLAQWGAATQSLDNLRSSGQNRLLYILRKEAKENSVFTVKKSHEKRARPLDLLEVLFPRQNVQSIRLSYKLCFVSFTQETGNSTRRTTYSVATAEHKALYDVRMESCHTQHSGTIQRILSGDFQCEGYDSTRKLCCNSPR